jgi:hypothetical protein
MNAFKDQLLTGWPDASSATISSKGFRHYRTPDGNFPSVTTVLKTLGTGTEGLIKWSATEERKACLLAAAEVYAAGDADGPQAFADAVEAHLGAARSHQKILNKAGEIGTSIHEMIQWTLRTELGETAGPEPGLSDAALWGFMAWQDWWKASGLVPVRIEQPIWDPEIGYAGTIDLIAQGPNGLELLDWKTGKGIYEAYHLQVAAYAYAARRWAEVGRCRIVRLPKVIGDPQFDVAELGDLYGGLRLEEPQLFAAFRCTLDLWNLLVRPIGKD